MADRADAVAERAIELASTAEGRAYLLQYLADAMDRRGMRGDCSHGREKIMRKITPALVDMARMAAVALAVSLVITLMLTLAGCSSGAHSSTPQAAASSSTPTAVSPSPSQPAGCDEARLVTGTVRGELENAADNSTFSKAYHQLAGLGRSLPLGQLRIDVDRANFDLTQYWERPSLKLAMRFAADLRRIESDCSA